MIKAIDIVLLPPDELANDIVRFNKRLKSDGEQIDFSRDCIPHLTLGMGCMDDSEVDKLFAEASCDFKAINLKATGVVTYRGSSQPVWQLKFERTEELINLHEKVMSEIARCKTAIAEGEMFFGGRGVSDGTIKYVRDFALNHSHRDFEPHITLGYGEPASEINLRIYTFKRIAVCHLGNHNTCREILAQSEV